MKSKMKWIITMILVAISIVAYVVFGNGASQESSANITSTTLNEFTIIEMPLTETYTTTGTITPQEDDILAAPFDSRIDKKYVELGQKVKKGDVLYELDATDVQDQIRSMEYDIAVLNSSINSSSIVGSIAKENAVIEAEKTLNTTKSDWDDAKQIFDAGALSQLELDNYETAYNNANNRYLEAKKTLDAYYAENDITLSKRKLELLELSLQDLKDELEDTKILAPFDGVVTSVYKNEGDAVVEKDQICRITNMLLLDVKASISEYDLQKFTIGMPATVSTLSDRTKTYTASVSALGYLGEISGSEVTLPLTLTLDKANDVQMLLPNFTVTIEILTDSSENALVVPFEAVSKNKKGESIVMKKSGDKNVPVVVESGITNELYMEVLSDELSAGDTIVYSTAVENTANNSRSIIPMGGGVPPSGKGRPAGSNN
ncbi:efflux RND transporter periplasmic adaptor subunit [Fusibacter ferrireducens]|uniref:Efflux RND transporter periplasmic adaptor subunit n=1 Tax=Fusibacter ferrireducens TaxID=2785058 RepID=A0ABR9ZQG2_9FIRM|nr:efflux RND transporter periplasmic adaptor subunit [Fusibacter ferrireducens]MBF4692664.1 efflux RND transporter periplasmic adaptor subunit [Fusibacter ferrireducens]